MRTRITPVLIAYAAHFRTCIRCTQNGDAKLNAAITQNMSCIADETQALSSVYAINPKASKAHQNVIKSRIRIENFIKWSG